MSKKDELFAELVRGEINEKTYNYLLLTADFVVGARVIGTGVSDGFDIKGRKGTIRIEGNYEIGVEFDEANPQMHRLRGTIKAKHGWFVDAKKLRLLKEEEDA